MRELTLKSDLYDAAIDLDRWPDILDRIATSVGAKSGIILSTHRSETPLYQAFRASTVFDRESLQFWQSTYASFEMEAAQRFAVTEPFKILCDRDVWPDRDAYLRRADIRFLRERFGFLHKFGARLNDESAWLDLLVVHLDESAGEPTGDHYLALSKFFPAAAQTLRLAHVFQILKDRFRAVLSVLDRYHVASILVDVNGTAIVSNRQAGNVLDQHDGITIGPDRRVSLRLPDEDVAFKAAISRAAATANAEEDVPNAQIHVTRPSGKESFFLEISPIRDTDRELESVFRGGLLTIYDPDSARSVELGGFARLHLLTDAETKIMQLIVDGAETEEIAQRRNTSIGTVRTQIKNVLAKTGSRSRVDLVRRAISSSPPIDLPKG